jgi:V-type H+-transporting ATPase subunit C
MNVSVRWLYLGLQREIKSLIQSKTQLSSFSKLAEDDEFQLYAVVAFRKYRDEFLQKCRENKYIPRDFVFDTAAADKQKKEFEDLEKSERALWVSLFALEAPKKGIDEILKAELLRISRLNFSECFELIVHLKFLRAYIESVLRYGVGMEYCYGIIKVDTFHLMGPLTIFLSLCIQPEPKQSSKLLAFLAQQLSPYVSESGNKNKNKKGGAVATDELGGEYANLMEQEWFDYILFEIPIADNLGAGER